MRRAALLLLLIAAGCGSDDPNPAAPGHGELAQLTVTVDEDGGGGTPPRELTLNCHAPTDSTACGAAAGVSAADVAPTPAGKACAQIFGGPETASIKGTIRGDSVDATFSRKDACEIARWKRVEDLLAEVR